MLRRVLIAPFVMACAGSPTAASKAACSGGDLGVGRTPMVGDFNLHAGCRRADPLSGDTTFTRTFGFPVESGQGYLVTLSGAATLNPRLELTHEGTLLALSRAAATTAHLLFASATTQMDSVWALPADTLASDTGSYSIAVRSCTVPVAPLALGTDSITHSDTITPSDCQFNYAELAADTDRNMAQVHLFAVHWDSADALRRIAYRSDVPLRLILGGAHDDTFAGDTGTIIFFSSRAVLGDTIRVGSIAGDYTIMLATDSPAPTTAHYTLTIGSEVPITPHASASTWLGRGCRRTTCLLLPKGRTSMGSS